jgi:hypothetical protein
VDTSDELPPEVIPNAAPNEQAEDVVAVVDSGKQFVSDAGPPTHVRWFDGAVDFVRPFGFTEAAELEELPPGFDPAGWRADPETRTLVEDWSTFDASLHARIDTEAGNFRLRFITDAPGQMLIYQRKEREARAWQEAISPNPSDFPFLTVEANATGRSCDEVAAAIVTAADRLALVGSMIEGVRFAAKLAVTTAPTRVAKEAAAAIDWESVAASMLPVE